MISHKFKLNKQVTDKKSDQSPIVDYQVLSYEVLNSTTFKYRFGDFEKKSVLSNSAL